MGKAPNQYYVNHQGQYIIRYVDERQLPKPKRTAEEMGDAARDSVIRYAAHFGLSFKWLIPNVVPYEIGTIWIKHDGEMWPTRWRWARATGIVLPSPDAEPSHVEDGLYV